MNVRFCGHLSVMAALALAGACKSDPTASDAGTPNAMQVSQNPIFLIAGQSKRISAGVVDKLLDPLSDPVTASSNNTGVTSVAPDSSLPDPSGTRSFFTVTGVSAAQAIVTFTGGGVSAAVPVNVIPAVPTFSTSPSAGGAIGVTLNDNGTLAGGFSLSGTITFQLFDPTQTACTGTPRYTQTVTVNGANTYTTSPGFVTDMTGTWNWTAQYSGDANNVAAASACGDESVTVKAVPTFSTSPSAGGAIGVTLNDSGTLAGGSGTLSGTITFQLFDPTQTGCTGTPRYTQTVTVNGANTYPTSPGFVTDMAGTWNWTAQYSGDANNAAAASACGAESVTVT